MDTHPREIYTFNINNKDAKELAGRPAGESLHEWRQPGPFVAGDAGTAATIRAELEQEGRIIDPYDLLIAGQALSRSMTLVTANVRDFSRVRGLIWEDWTNGNKS